MTFDQLLGDSPRQTAEQWAARAEKEWRGRAAEQFDVELGDGARVSPFVKAADAAPALHRPERAPWLQLSDLRGARIFDLYEVALEELEGGAQGFCLNVEQLAGLRKEAGPSAIRYDFLTLYLTGVTAVVSQELGALVPDDQRGGLQVFPDLMYVPSATDTVAALTASLPQLEARKAQDHAEAPTLLVHIPSDYLRAVTLLGALDLIWANVHGGSPAGVPPLRIVASISPGPGRTTPEAYLIDASVRAVAAVSAGVDALTIEPFSERPEHRRQARNLGHLLQLEAGLHDFGDALTGAAWFEEAIIAAATAAWNI